MDNKDKIILALIVVLAISATINGYLVDRHDMPEEINCISNNPTTPDTLTGYTDGKVIHIQYMRRK